MQTISGSGGTAGVGGPLADATIIEFAGIGPAPFAAMILAGLGADVIRIDRPATGELFGETDWISSGAMNRDRRSIVLDLKNSKAVEIIKALVSKADGVIEGFRPGVMERLGLGPTELHAVNPQLTYVRMTGWGQSGPMAQIAGHDLDFIAMTGLLDAIGPEESPAIPLNLLGDFGGGGTMAAIGMLAGILKGRSSGVGSVVDAAIVDGVSLLGTMFQGLISQGLWGPRRSTNLLDGGAPFYSIYKCADGLELAVASLEPKFFSELLERLGLAGNAAFSDQYNSKTWPEMRLVLAKTFSGRERAYFEKLFEGSDACVAAVNSILDAKESPHLVDRRVFENLGGVAHPRPAPRFEGYEPSISPPPRPGDQRDEILEGLGFSPRDINALESSGAFG